MAASSRLDLDNEVNRSDETRIDVDFEDGDFPALKRNYDRKEHANHSCRRRGRRGLAKRWDFGSIGTISLMLGLRLVHSIIWIVGVFVEVMVRG